MPLNAGRLPSFPGLLLALMILRHRGFPHCPLHLHNLRRVSTDAGSLGWPTALLLASDAGPSLSARCRALLLASDLGSSLLATLWGAA